MGLLQDPGLAAQATQLPETFATARQALATSTGDKTGTRGLESPDAEAVGPPPLPGDVLAAEQAFRQEWQQARGTSLVLTPVQYFRYVNNELVEGWTTHEEPGADLVQISQTVAITGRAGTYLDVRQWLARAAAPA